MLSTLLSSFFKVIVIKKKMRIPPVYNAEEKVWRGPEIDQRMFDVPFGELLLSQLKKHGEKLFQVFLQCGIIF